MTGKRNIGSMTVIGGLTAAIALLTGLPAASADELADLRANQELLQKRIDQLSQAPPPAPGPFVPGFGPEARPASAPVSTGSFPRSFLIPGTDTSLRIGGIAWTDILWLMHGSRAAQVLNNTGGNPDGGQNGIGGTGTLASIPLNNSTAHSRAQSFTISSRPSRLLFDARTPTAWGEIKAYVEMDFAHSNENVVESGQTAVTNGYAPRLRKAYGTMGGLLVGQETGIFHDPDADAELLDFGGGASSPGRARTPQVKYTYQGPYGAVFTAGFENPSPRMQSVNGQSDLDTQASSALTACSATLNIVANLPATTACLANTSFFNPLQSGWPELVGTGRINQPWGHLQVGVMVRTDRLNDGQYLDQKFVGYGGTISGDVHPFSGTPGPLGKDDLGFGFGAGVETAGQLANGAGVVTTFGRALSVPGFGLVNPLTSAQWNTANSPTRQAYDRVVQSQSPRSTDAWVWYQHWWTENLRSTIEVSGIYNNLNLGLLGACTSCNKALSASRVNLIWSPVAFVDMGVEYGWGHRVTTQNFKGDAYELIGSMRVRF
jgi:Porin subfamily/DcaP outer membrane protein